MQRHMQCKYHFKSCVYDRIEHMFIRVTILMETFRLNYQIITIVFDHVIAANQRNRYIHIDDYNISCCFFSISDENK